MISATRANRRSSFNCAVVCAAVTAVVTLTACEKKADGAASTDASPANAAPAANAAAKPKATLKAADAKSAYAAEFNDNSKMTDPTEKKVAAFVAKVGKPDSDTGRKMTWLTLDGDKCTKIELDTKDGSMTDSTTSNADCGM
jgi:hypothetical protein